MNNLIKLTLAASLWIPTAALADKPDLEEVKVYDRERGELSVGTEAPSRERMMNAIKSASPVALTAMLEYGERVECHACVPLLEDKLLSSDNGEVREIAAWWLRRRPFSIGRAMVKMKDVLANDSDAERRARAAEAIGEFLDHHGAEALSAAAIEDKSARVRGAAVRGLGRMNVVSGNVALSSALDDEDAGVRRAALSVVLKVNFFRDHAAVIGRLADEDSRAQRMAVQLVGELRVTDAVAPLVMLLETSDDAGVRRSAAFALGQIGGSAARDGLREAEKSDKDDSVQDAIDIALQMRR